MTWFEWLCLVVTMTICMWSILKLLSCFDFQYGDRPMETVEVVVKITVEAKDENEYHDQIQEIDSIIPHPLEIVSERFSDEIKGRRLKCYYTKN